jgi:hypothetical protein
MDALKSAAAVLGTTVSVGMRVLSKAELELAIDGAWVAFQMGFQEERMTLEMMVGLAGELASEAVLPRILGIDLANVFNLNEILERAPVFDLITSVEPVSVKVFGPLSSVAGRSAERLSARYLEAALELIGDEPTHKISGKRKLEKAIDFIWNSRPDIKGDPKRQIPGAAWPKGVNSRAALEAFVRDKGKMLVPKDHVNLARRALGEYLETKMPNPRHITNAQAEQIQTTTFNKIDSIGLTVSNFEELLEASKHLPPDALSRMPARAQAWRRRVARMNRRK